MSTDHRSVPAPHRWAEDWTTIDERTNLLRCVTALAEIRVQLNDLVASFRQPSLDLEFEVEQAERLLLDRAV